MLTVSEAEKIILQNALVPETEIIPISAALHRVAATPLRADRDFPPFDRVTMDGIAITFERFKAGQRSFPVFGVAAAGKPCQTLDDLSGCIEVMTGAMLPTGADAVIRYEDISLAEGIATIDEITVNFRQNIHFQGVDRKKDNIVVPAYRQIGPAEIGAAATVGAAEIAVFQLPRVALISTGDELLPVSATPLPHQIRGSNILTIQALLQDKFNIESQIFHFPDDEQLITDTLRQMLPQFDVILLSGAVSEGKFDHIPKVMHTLGVEKLFHKVAQRPGKPFWFGKFQHLKKDKDVGNNQHNVVIFALPGNPVSTFLCACRYVLPFLRKSMGMDALQPHYVVLAEPISFLPELTYYVPSKISYSTDGKLLANPLPGHGSGDLANLVDADGFLELPPNQSTFTAGAVFPFILYRR